MAQMVAAAMGKPGTEDFVAGPAADTEAWYGSLKSARELTRRAMDSADATTRRDCRTYQVAAALRDVESGDRSRRMPMPMPQSIGSKPRRAGYGGTGSGPGRRHGGGRELAVELDKTFPLDTLVQIYWLPTIRAAVALERKDRTAQWNCEIHECY